MRRTIAGTLVAIGGVGLLLTGCGGASSSSPTSSSPTASGSASAAASGSASAAATGSKTVRLIQGGGFDFSDAAIYKAMATLKSEGYNVTLDNVDDPATALRSVLAGKEDVYLGDPVEAATAVANGGAQLKYLASLAQTSDYEILALPNVKLSSLSGTKLATAGPGTAGQIVAVAALQKQGVNVSQVHQVTVGGTSARVTAILAGQVDMAPVLAPAAVAAAATGKVKILLNAGNVLGDYLQQGLIASDSFASNTATAQATVNAFIDAERWAQSNKAAFISEAKSAGLLTGLTASEADAAWTQLQSGHYFATNGALCDSAITSTLSYAYKSPGGLTASTTPKTSDWIDSTYVNAYLTQHGQSAGTC